LTPRELETRLATQREQTARVEEAKARLNQAKLDLKWTEVRAPISGRISDARIDAGNLITGGQANATLLTTIVSLSPIHFVFEGSEADYLKYSRKALSGKRPSSREVDNPVLVKLADEAGFVHRGKMEFVDNVLDAKSGTIRARAIFENNESVLLPGLFGRLRLFGGQLDALLVPDTAIASDQAKKIVFIVGDDGTVSQKTVTLGPIVEGLRVIRSGLRAKDRVVINGIQRARPGQKVTPQEGKIEAQTLARN
ncbi:MAG: efflux RND transporter periplasmic adaptor subunit, partial [Methyloligellaceae bacterium]